MGDYFCCLLTAMAVFSLPALALLMSLMSQFGCDAKMVNFDDHYKAWAKRKAGELRRSLSWTDAYGKHKIDVEYGNIQYQTATRDVAKPGFTFEEWIHNGGSTATTGKFAKTKSVTASFTWSITEGLTIGTENTFKAGIPGVVGGDLKFKTKLSLSSTQGK